jgi:hypothetical protein
MRAVRQRHDAADLVFVDVMRAGVEIADDGDAQAFERGAAGAGKVYRIGGDAQARWLEPEAVKRKRRERRRERKDDDDNESAACAQNLIRARLSSETLLVPTWPA